MAVFNLQALADRARYFEQVQGMSAQDAEAQAFKEAGFEGQQDLPQGAYQEFQSLLSNRTTDSEFARNDKDRLLNRREAGSQAKYDVNPQPDTTTSDAGLDSNTTQQSE
jgi:hypothetical protein